MLNSDFDFTCIKCNCPEVFNKGSMSRLLKCCPQHNLATYIWKECEPTTLKNKPDLRNSFRSFLLLASIFFIVCLVCSTDGSDYTIHYANDYSILNGTYVSGNAPLSVTSVDANYFIVRSEGTDASVNPYNPSGYTLLGSTSQVSGSISNLTSNDGTHMVFSSYFSGLDMKDYVDNATSDVDSIADKGTHSNFTAQQYGPDSINDTLTEENNPANDTIWLYINADDETRTDWTRVGTNPCLDAIDYPTNFVNASGNNLQVGDFNFTDSGKSTEPINSVEVQLYTQQSSASRNLEVFVWDGSSWTSLGTQATPTSWGWMNWTATTVLDTWTKIDDAKMYITSRSPVGTYEVDCARLKVDYTNPNYELDLEVQWTNADFDETNEWLAIYVDKWNNTYSLDATGGYMIIGDGTPDWGSVTGTISFWVQWDTVANRSWGQHENMETRFSGSNLTLDWGATGSLTSNTSFTTGKWYFIAIVWDENTDDLYLYAGDQDNPPTLDAQNNAWLSTVSDEGVTQNNFMASKSGVDPTDGHGDDLRYWNTDRTLTDIQSDYDTELTGSETNLRSYFKLNNNFDDIGPDNNNGSGSGSYSFSSDVPFGAPPTENIRVDVWNGTAWQNRFTNLTNGWNNASVSSYLNSSTFTIRFTGGNETGDTTQDAWNIDAVLLHVWTDQYTAEVEFAGSSNTYNGKQLNWTFDSAWTTGSVSVTIQLYNYTLGDYPTSGNGFISYTSSATANTDETKNQTITTNDQHFHDAAGDWKIKVKAVKTTTIQFNFKADWIMFEPTHWSEYTVSAEFFFSNATTNTPTQLNFTVVSQYILASVNVTIQVWNYSASAYATSGEAYFKYTSSGTNETKLLNLNTNPQYYISNGNAKMKITSLSATTTQYQQEVNQVELRVSTQTSLQPSNWFTTLLYVLPFIFGLLFLLALKLKRKKTTASPKPTGSPEGSLRERKPRKSHVAKKTDMFSQQFGTTHQQIKGKKMLLEIDPTTDNHKDVLSFISEAKNNDETLFILTNKNSVLHSVVSGDPDVNFLLLTSETSSPLQINEKETLLPATDLSALLNSFNSIPKKETKKTINVVFDNLSDIILRCGPKKTYKFIPLLLEAISSPKVTALFVFNPTAHGKRVQARIRGMLQKEAA